MTAGWGRWAWRGRGMASKARALGLALVAALVMALALAGCSLSAIAGGASGAGQRLGALPWCAQPQRSFVDSSASSQQSLTSWDQVKGQLGFTPYLPSSLPTGSCLDLVGATIHDPIFGGRLSVTWVLPSGDPISFSEAPRRGNTGGSPQCDQSAQGSGATTVCIGAVGETSVTIASHLSRSQVMDYFQRLQPATDWEPAPGS